MIVGQSFPVWQCEHRNIGLQEQRQFTREDQRVGRTRDQHDEWSVCRCKFGNRR